jgi:hypothetical protein
VNTSPPTISGTAQQGQTLTAGPGTWSGTQPITYAYQWRQCTGTGTSCVDLNGATATTYVPGSADVGHAIRVFVTATNKAGAASLRSAPTAAVQAATGLSALWHMDETSGTVMHDAVGNHTGTLNSVQVGQPGYLGTAFGFGGSGYVSVPSADDLNPGGATITITIHLNTTSTPASPDWDLIRKGLFTTSGGEYKMEYQPSGQASCGFNGSSSYSELMAGPALNDGRWHTVQCVKTSSAITLIVDGQSFSQSATVGTIANTDSLVIGARPGSDYFQGSLDEASIQIG